MTQLASVGDFCPNPECDNYGDVEAKVIIRSELSTWVKENAIPFATDDPTGDLDDLAGLSELVGDARVVALGEATHGTAEFFHMKHRIFRYLVEKEDFRVFMIEANLPESIAVNEYVLTGAGDVKTALAGLRFWTWRTQEVLELIEWMREWNINHSDDPVYFHGFDVQFWRGGSDRFLTYIQVVDPTYAQGIEDDLYCQTGDEFPEHSADDDCSSRLLAIKAHYDKMQDTYVEMSSEFDYVLHRQVLQTVLDHDQLPPPDSEADDATYFNKRDRFMADQVIAFAEDLFPDDRIVLWAHNVHVQSARLERNDALYYPMGTNLRDYFGEDYINFGFVFNTGSFNAIEIFNNGNFGRLRELSVLALLPDSHEYILRSIDEPRYFLDTRVDELSPAYDWLTDEQFLRGIGGVYNIEAEAEQFAYPTILRAAYHVLIYFEDTSPSILLP